MLLIVILEDSADLFTPQRAAVEYNFLLMKSYTDIMFEAADTEHPEMARF